jgi:DNA recombination protein RmuC
MEIWLIAFVAISVGIVIGLLVVLPGRKADRARAELLQQTVDKLQDNEQKYQREQLELLKESERLREKLSLAEEKLLTQKKEVGELQQLLTNQFKNLASEILEDKSKRFTETNRENIEKILQIDMEQIRNNILMLKN